MNVDVKRGASLQRRTRTEGEEQCSILFLLFKHLMGAVSTQLRRQGIRSDIQLVPWGSKRPKPWLKSKQPPGRGLTWALLPASPSQLCALLLSAASGARRSSAPEGGPVCPPARLSQSSSGSPASACDGESFSCIVCWSAPFPPSPPLRQANEKTQSHNTTTETRRF